MDIHAAPAYNRGDVGIAVVLEGRRLFGELSVESNLKLAATMGARRQGAKFQFSLDDIYDLFPFMPERRDAPVDVLSGGEQQMVAIGRALLLKPELLILDEPSTGLAPKVVGDIVKVIAALRKRGMSLLLLEQNVVVALESADRAYLLSVGKIVDNIDGERWRSGSLARQLMDAYLGGDGA